MARFEGGVTYAEVWDAMRANDLDTIIEMLDDFEIKKGEGFRIDPGTYDLARHILSTASAFVANGHLRGELMLEAVERFATAVHFMHFIRLAWSHNECCDPRPVSKRQETLRDMLSSIQNAEEIGEWTQRVEYLSEDEFTKLTNALLYMEEEGEFEKMHISWNVAFIRYVYQHSMLPDSMLFAYMAITLRQPSTMATPIAAILAGPSAPISGLMADMLENGFLQ